MQIGSMVDGYGYPVFGKSLVSIDISAGNYTLSTNQAIADVILIYGSQPVDGYQVIFPTVAGGFKPRANGVPIILYNLMASHSFTAKDPWGNSNIIKQGLCAYCIWLPTNGQISPPLFIGPDISTVLSQTIGNTRGSVLYASAGGWSALTPGTSGQTLTTGGAGLDPSWANTTDGYAMKEIAFTVNENGSTWTSTTSIPAGSFVVSAQVKITNPFGAGATISIGQYGGSTSAYMATTDIVAQGAANSIYEVIQHTGASNKVTGTVTTTFSAGTAICYIKYITPLP